MNVDIKTFHHLLMSVYKVMTVLMTEFAAIIDASIHALIEMPVEMEPFATLRDITSFVDARKIIMAIQIFYALQLLHLKLAADL